MFLPKGRIGRASYIGYIFTLFIFLISIQAIIPFEMYSHNNKIDFLLTIISLWCLGCLTTQRLQDIGKSMNHLLLFLVPFYNLYLLYCVLFNKSINRDL